MHRRDYGASELLLREQIQICPEGNIVKTMEPECTSMMQG
jgi:hypothetical protein